MKIHKPEVLFLPSYESSWKIENVFNVVLLLMLYLYQNRAEAVIRIVTPSIILNQTIGPAAYLNSAKHTISFIYL